METIHERYLAVWNETDAARRADLLRETFSEEATYQDPLMQGQGLSEIDALVQAVHARFPGAVFQPKGGVEAVGDHIRFSWTLGPKDGSPAVGGTDFALLNEGRFKNVVGFLDFVEVR